MYVAPYANRLAPTWAVVTGTPKTAHPVTNLGDGDPSAIHWIDETAIRVAGDLGAAFEIQAVFLFNHTFRAGLNVRFQANASNVWMAPTLDEAIPIPTWYQNGFSCHAALNLMTALPSAVSRTFRYVSVANITDANDRSVAIGEIWIAGIWKLAPTTEQDIGHDYTRPSEHLASPVVSKRGVQTVEDHGSRARSLQGSVRTDATGLDEMLDLADAQHGRVRQMVMVLDPSGPSRRDQEPHLGRFQNIRQEPHSLVHGELYDVAWQFEESGCGEIIGV